MQEQEHTLQDQDRNHRLLSSLF